MTQWKTHHRNCAYPKTISFSHQPSFPLLLYILDTYAPQEHEAESQTPGFLSGHILYRFTDTLMSQRWCHNELHLDSAGFKENRHCVLLRQSTYRQNSERRTFHSRSIMGCFTTKKDYYKTLNFVYTSFFIDGS